MISHTYKCVFIHIPKCAGTSVEVNFSNKHSNHCPAAVFARKYPRKFKNYFKFSFVRNPFDRLVSVYAYYVNGGNKSKHDEPIAHEYRKVNFREFVKCINVMYDDVECRVFVDKLDLNSPRGTQHIYPQHTFLEINNSLCMDFIGKFENIKEDYENVKNKLGFQHSLPVLRQTKHKHYTEYYDDETKQIVAEKYAKDIEYFGYKFGE